MESTLDTRPDVKLAFQLPDEQPCQGAAHAARALAAAARRGDGRLASDDQLDREGALHPFAAARHRARPLLRHACRGDLPCRRPTPGPLDPMNRLYRTRWFM